MRGHFGPHEHRGEVVGPVVTDKLLESPELASLRVLGLQYLQNLDKGGMEAGDQKLANVHLK